MDPECGVLMNVLPAGFATREVKIWPKRVAAPPRIDENP